MRRSFAFFALLSLAACSPPRENEVVVLAAASVETPLRALAARHEAARGERVRISAAATSELVAQVRAGAPGDVFVSASARHLDGLIADGLARPGVVVARNELVAIVGRGTTPPPDARALERVGVGEQGVPVGDYARAALAKARATPKLVSFPSEPAVVAAVADGAVPVGIVYRSSLVSHAARDRIALAFRFADQDVVYPAAVLVHAKNEDGARAFLSLLTSEEGRAAFAAAGFDGAIGAPAAPGAASGEVRALVVSLEIGAVAIAGVIPVGLALAWLLARARFAGRDLVEALILAPLVLPPVAIGFALLRALGRGGAGEALAGAGLGAVGTWRGAAIASAALALPLFVRVARAAMESVDARLEQQAATLGASPSRIALTITFPLAARGLVAATVLALARALGEFGATVVVAGSLDGETRTLPLAIWSALERGDPAAAQRGASLALALAVALAFAATRLERRRA